MTLYRDSYALINLNNLIYNVEKVYHKTNKPLMAIIKADAYGHGSKEVAMCLNDNKYIEMFGVATLQEAIELRELGIKRDILILGAIPKIKNDIDLAIKYDISLTLFSLDYLELLTSLVEGKPLKVHIKLDTGMNRLGLKGENELKQILANVDRNKFIVDGIFTHFATADCDKESYEQQLKLFDELVDQKKFKYVHCSNSAGLVYHDENKSNLGRIGIAMYGVDPAGDETSQYKQVMSLFSKVVMVKEIKKGEHVGYGYSYTASQDEIIATLPIGYADGMVRKNQGRDVYINGKFYPIVGRVCMDQMMVRVDKDVKVDDEVEIFGEHISLAKMAKELDTIAYEVMCLITKRVERVYEK